MGVYHLETFIKNYVPNGTIEVSIVDECRRFQNENGSRATLVIDLMGMFETISSNPIETLCGGRHSHYRKVLETLLTRLSAVADLVFFEDGPTVSEKMFTNMERRNRAYERSIFILDQVYEGKKVEEIVKDSYDIPRLTTFLTMIEETAKKFGKLIVTVTKECDTEIARYAINNPSVLAVMSNDSDFLIFSGRWRYFSLNGIELKHLTTLEFNRLALRECLGLNDKQLMILSTLGGNDIIKRDELKSFHKKNKLKTPEEKFHFLARFIKRLPMDFYPLLNAIACEVLRSNRPETKNRIEDSLKQYSTKFDITDNSVSNPLLHLCTERYYDFSFRILKDLPDNLTLVYYDMRCADFPNFYEIQMTLFRKQIGILLQHKRTKPGGIHQEVCTKKSHDEPYEQFFESPTYPEVQVPPLMEFLNRQNHPEHDALRWTLLEWTICDDSFGIAGLKEVPKNYFLDIFTLVFLTRNGFISVPEADLILFTIKNVEQDLIPASIQPPDVLNERAFRISFLFSKMSLILQRSMEVTGFKDSMMKLVNFDGVFFHIAYLKSISSGLNPNDLADIEQFRLYK